MQLRQGGDVEDEGELHGVGGAQLTVQRLGAPGELVGVRVRPRVVGGVGLGHTTAALAEERIGHDGRPEFPGGRPRTLPTEGLEKSGRIAVRACRGGVDVGVGRRGVVAHRGEVEVALLGVGSDEQVDAFGGARGHGVGRLHIEDQAERAQADQRIGVGLGPQVDTRQLGHDLDEPLVGDGGEGVRTGLDAKGLRRRPGHAGGLLGAEGAQPAAALDDGVPEETFGLTMGQDTADDGGSRGLTEQGDVARVAAEGRDVGTHPPQGGDDVEQTPVGGGAGEVEEAGDAQSVVEGHEDDAVASERAAVVERGPGRAGHEPAAVHEDHHGEVAGRSLGRPHVDGEVVLPGDPAGAEVRGHVQVAERVPLGLRCRGPGLGGVAHPVPRSVGLRGREAAGAHGRCGVGDVEEDGGAVLVQTADGTLLGSCEGIRVLGHRLDLSRLISSGRTGRTRPRT